MEILARTGRSQALPKAMLGPALSKLVEVRTVANFFLSSSSIFWKVRGRKEPRYLASHKTRNMLKGKFSSSQTIAMILHLKIAS